MEMPATTNAPALSEPQPHPDSKQLHSNTHPKSLPRRGALRKLAGAFIGTLSIPLIPGSADAAEMWVAPNPDATAIDQLILGGRNACGPAALINSLRTGSQRWRSATVHLNGKSEKARLWDLIRTHGLQPSNHLAGRLRWTKSGIILPDLADMANDFTAPLALPRLKSEIFFLAGEESQRALLSRVHRRLSTSLNNGFPPILSIRRFALRKSWRNPARWIVVDGHCVTLTALPRAKPAGGHPMPVKYLDPWSAMRAEGRIAIPKIHFDASSPVTAEIIANKPSPCLEADFPQASVGKQELMPTEPTILTLAGAIGCW